jgi:hypothetical protein
VAPARTRHPYSAHVMRLADDSVEAVYFFRGASDFLLDQRYQVGSSGYLAKTSKLEHGTFYGLKSSPPVASKLTLKSRATCPE